jgi:hypothetical protein
MIVVSIYSNISLYTLSSTDEVSTASQRTKKVKSDAGTLGRLWNFFWC